MWNGPLSRVRGTGWVGPAGPPRIKEETIRGDFSAVFDFEWLRDIHFDSRNPDVKGPSAWSIHLRRKSG